MFRWVLSVRLFTNIAEMVFVIDADQSRAQLRYSASQ